MVEFQTASTPPNGATHSCKAHIFLEVILNNAHKPYFAKDYRTELETSLNIV